MAKGNKTKDPTEAGLSAVENALSFNPAEPSEPRDLDEGVREPRLPDATSDAFPALPARASRDDTPALKPAENAEPRRQAEVVSPDRAAVANDDREAIGAVLQALQMRPSRRAYVFAALAAVLWIGGFAALIWRGAGPEAMPPLADLTTTQLIVGSGALLAPVVFLFLVAMLSVRSQELKIVARAVGEVAVRLTQPETVSTEAVPSVSQAVRREVAAVGDGVERALARAGELETLVRGEIATLERAYGDNEIRIRSLIDELVSQREAIVANGERVRDAISGSHERFADELSASSRRIVETVGDVREQGTGALERRREEITRALGDIGERVVRDMAANGAEVVERIAGTGEAVKA